MAIITIAKISRRLQEGISKTGKNAGKPYSFESLGLAPLETELTDINGDTFERDERWLSGISKAGVTDSWSEGDRVKINLVRTIRKDKEGVDKEYINFRLPEGVDPMVAKFNAVEEVIADPDDF